MHICPCPNTRQLSRICREFLSIVNANLWIDNDPLVKVRQLAAVELRKRVRQKSGDLWVQLPQESREQIKSELPKLILAEPKYVRIYRGYLLFFQPVYFSVSLFVIPLLVLWHPSRR